MKKLIALLVCISLFTSLFVMPVSAEQPKDLLVRIGG